MSGGAEAVWRSHGTDVGVAIMLRGGKITSLTGPDGHEWLAQPEGAVPCDPPHVFTEAEMCGWDECAPTIDPCVLGDVSFGDHGDLWARQWELLDGTATACRLAVLGPRGDYRLERAATVLDRTLRLDYTVTALGGPVPWLWAAHPQFAVGPDASVDWPGRGRPVADVEAEGAPLVPWNESWSSIGTLTRGGSRKFYVDPATSVRSADLHDDGRTLHMAWAGDLPYLGFWFDRARFARTDVIAIEPTSGYYDNLERAVRNGRVTVVAPGRHCEWSLTVTL